MEVFFLSGILSKSTFAIRPVRSAATAEERPGSHAISEPAALPVKIPLRILFRESLSAETDSSGIFELVRRLIISWDAPKSPLSRGRRIDGSPKLTTGTIRDSLAKAKSPSTPVIKNKTRAKALCLYFAREPFFFESSPFSVASMRNTIKIRIHAIRPSR